MKRVPFLCFSGFCFSVLFYDIHMGFLDSETGSSDGFEPFGVL